MLFLNSLVLLSVFCQSFYLEVIRYNANIKTISSFDNKTKLV